VKSNKLQQRIVAGLLLGMGVLMAGTASADPLEITSSEENTVTGSVTYSQTDTGSTLASSGIYFASGTDSTVDYNLTVDGTVTARGNRAGISVASVDSGSYPYTPITRNLSITADAVTAESTTTETMGDFDEWPYTRYPAAGIYVEGNPPASSSADTLSIATTDGVTANGYDYGIYVDGQYADYGYSASVTIQSDGDNAVSQTGDSSVASPAGIGLYNNVEFTMVSEKGSNTVTSANGTGLFANPDNGTSFGTVTLQAAQDNVITGNGGAGIAAYGTSSTNVTYNEEEGTISQETSYLGSDILLEAENNNSVTGSTYGILLNGGSSLTLQAGGTNTVTGGNTGAVNQTYGTLTLYGNSTAQGDLYGLWTDARSDTVLDAQGGTIEVDALQPYVESVVTYYDEDWNPIETTVQSPSAAIVSMTGGATTLQGSTLIISGTQALVAAHTYAELSNAYADDPYASSPINEEDDRPSSITLSYGEGSTVTGDIYAYDNGIITIAPEDGGTISITGDVNAWGWDYQVGGYEMENRAAELGSGYIEGMSDSLQGGTVSITLGDGSTLTGRTDTGLLTRTLYLMDSTSDATYAPEIGTLDLYLNNGSTWVMTGHSTVTTLGGDGGTVYYENGGDALEIETLTGSHTFALDLDAEDGSNSDMIYIVNGTSDAQTLVVKNLTTLDSQMEDGDAVRFATVQNSQNEFVDGSQVAVVASGLYNDKFNVEYRTVSSDPLNTESYNDAYNGDGTRKPTTEYVETNYGGDNAQNVYLVKSQDLNKGALSPALTQDLTWRSLTDLDTFTNRSGESQYFTPGADQGAWVRLRYHNLGVDDGYELNGNTYELGWTVVPKNTETEKHRFSVSGAYTKNHGQWEGYDGRLALRDTSLNLYDTHEYRPSAEEMAKKPAWKAGTRSYWDSYFKYHHAKVDYRAEDPVTGVSYDSDYDRDVFNLSTEYGRENKLSEKWSIVPQAQVQLSYLGSFDGVDSQGLSYDGDHAWSLVGRLGFDLVKKMDPKLDNKLYFKASVLHEFLDGGDTTVSALGESYRTEGDQSGTWGVLGLGYSANIGSRQYFYLDAERYVGHDFRRTYNVRAGINWKF
jgi:outer membrane autotransporter protein